MTTKQSGFIFLLTVLLFSCSTGVLKYGKEKEQFKNVEFDNKVKIVETEVEKEEGSSPQENSVIGPKPISESAFVPEKKTVPVKPGKKAKTAKKTAATPVVLTRQPDIEDSEGFENQRRPLVDPFKVGEKVTHEVSYLGATAGKLSFSIAPYAVVNEKKAYNFLINIKSSAFFSTVFAVDDQVQTYMDYESLVPRAFKVNIRDSGQVKEAKSFFDFDTLKADYWEHKYTEKNGHEEKKLNWTILPFSQNPFSAIFYMRVFKWAVGHEYAFRVADDEKNIVFTGKALEKVKLKTEAGEFNAVKIKAEVTARGNLSKARDFFLWLSDDDRKHILRIEVKLPVGSLVSEVVEIKEGK